MYESNSDFIYIRDHHKIAFPKGETKETKAAGLEPYKTGNLTRYRKCVDNDNLVEMRCFFRQDYENRAAEWAETAKELREYLETGTIKRDISVKAGSKLPEKVQKNFESSKKVGLPESNTKASLDSMINKAKERTPAKNADSKEKVEQLSLF